MENKIIHLVDIAGYKEEKAEAIKLIDILKNYNLYKSKGASIPKGLLLYGVPGVGKTMFAKAVSIEANVPLYEFEASESENEEDSIKDLKDLFTKAKENTPSIVLIDELDELISSDDFGGYQSDYSRKTLKTLLTEIDGISSSDGVLVIATTNNKGSIPSSLRRSGRLEKQITFHTPTIEDRAEIAELYLKKAGIVNIDSKMVASKTDGFTGADIKSLINNAIIESVRKKEDMSMKFILSAIPTIRFGEIKKKKKGGPSPAVCYHEIGHFLAQYALTGEIGSLSVEEYGNIKGHMILEDDFAIPFRKKDDRSCQQIIKSLIVDLGGIAGEQVFLGERYCGSKSDISNAIESIDLVINNGYYGFEYFGSLDVEHGSGTRSIIGSIPYEAGKQRRCDKIVEVLTERLNASIEAVSKYKELGEIIFPILITNEFLSKEELTRIVTSYDSQKLKSNDVVNKLTVA